MKGFIVALAVAVAGGIVAVQSGFSAEAQAGEARQSQIARGEYLVHSVAMCVQCHSPRTASGKLIEEDLLHGAPMPVQSPYQNLRFALSAPHIAGMPGYDEQAAVMLLSQGKTRRGVAPMAPMPPFRMSEEDSKAVFAYLRSLE